MIDEPDIGAMSDPEACDPLAWHWGERSPLFADVPRAIRQQLLAQSQRRKFGPGEVLFRIGEPGEVLFLLLSGRVTILVPDVDGELIVNELGPGEWFGEMALLTGEPRSATAVAATESQVVVITRRHFQELVSSAPSMLLGINRYLSKRLREQTRMQRELTTQVIVTVTGGPSETERRFFGALASAILNLSGSDVGVVDSDALLPLCLPQRSAPAAGHLVLIQAGSFAVPALRRAHRLLLVRVCAGTQEMNPWLAAADVLLLVDTPEFSCPTPASIATRSRVFRCLIAGGHSGSAAPSENEHVTVIPLSPANDPAPVVLRHLVRRVLRRQVGLVLSAGGAKGLAHLGALSTLIRAGVEFDYIAGTSMGGIVGGLLAMGRHPQTLINDFVGLARNFRHLLLDFGMPTVSLLRGEKKQVLLQQETGDCVIEDLPIPFATVAADLVSGRETVFAKGPLSVALDATSAIPMIFPPVYADGRALVDGWVVNPLPADIVRRRGADVVIAVDTSAQQEEANRHYAADPNLGSRFRRWRTNPAIVSIAIRALEVGARERTLASLASVNVSICPDVGHFSSTDFRPIASIIERGAEAAEAALPQVLQVLRKSPQADVPA